MKLKFSMFFTVLVFVFCCFLSIANVNAAYAYLWEVDGERLNVGTSNKSSTASWVSDKNYTGGVLKLNNYNGGQLKIDCYGTGLGHVFAVKLIGDNTITVENGVGIIANVPVIFIGDGKLTINAAVPIGSGHVVNDNGMLTSIENAKWHASTTITIESSKNVNDENTDLENETNEINKEKDESNNENKETNIEENNNLIITALIISLGVSILCVIIIIALIIKNNKLKKINN